MVTLCICCLAMEEILFFFSYQRQTIRSRLVTLTRQWFSLAVILLVSSWAIIECNRPTSGETTCCEGITGNVDDDEQEIIDISDIIMLEEFLYQEGSRPNCLMEADVNGSLDRNPVNQEDLTYLVDYVFGVGPEPCECLYP